MSEAPRRPWLFDPPVALTAAWLLLYAAAPLGSVYLRLGLASAAVLVFAATRGRARLASWLLPRRADLVLGLGVGAALVALSYAGWALLCVLWPPLAGAGEATYALGALTQPLWQLPLLGLIVLAEEVLFRALWLEALGAANRQRAGAWAVLAYALGQVGSGQPLVVGLALCLGTVWTALALVRRSLWPSLLSHAVWLGTMLAFPPV